MVTYLGLLVQLCYGEGGTLQTHITGVWGECSQGLRHTGFAPTQGMCAFPVYTAQAPGCSAGELSKMGPGLHAFPRSKLLSFRFSGTPQRHRIGSVQFSHSFVSDSLRPHESQHTRPPCPSPTPGVHSDSRPSSQ